MYDWLDSALANHAQIITANRRLAKRLSEEHATRQVALGHRAWPTPAIHALPDWLTRLAASLDGQENLPTRINPHQSQILWERCLQKELGDEVNGLANLVRQARDAWRRMGDWNISVAEASRAAQSVDQELFAAAAGRYAGVLRHEGWVDDVLLGNIASASIADGKVPLAPRYTFAGFDRATPLLESVKENLREAGAKVETLPTIPSTEFDRVRSYEHAASELRAAGAWARRRWEENPEARIAIVVTGLESEADKFARLVREGLVPAWQYGPPTMANSLNVSYGQALAKFPAIAIALLSLRWLVRDVASVDLGLLLRSPLVFGQDAGDRARAELRLRQMPERLWSPAMVAAEFRKKPQEDCDVEADGTPWTTVVSGMSKTRRELPKSASPSRWAVLFHEYLDALAWPSSTSLPSEAFQLINRWRELLNEFARLELVSSRLSPHAAVARLEALANETIFQPESTQDRIQLLGPLEAAGLEFDALWIADLTSTSWPPAGNRSRLLSRGLQVQHRMPDHSPEDTLEYAQTVLGRLLNSAPTVVCSFARSADDSELTHSDLLGTPAENVHDAEDPGWHAGAAQRASELLNNDAVPSVTENEQISGGAATLQLFLAEPFSAFVQGRLSARRIYPQAKGITPPLRGNLLHDALYKLYLECPSQAELKTWLNTDIDSRIRAAVDFAFTRHERNVDAVLLQIFEIERQRLQRLLHEFVRTDVARADFTIAGVEGESEFTSGNIRLRLRFDRIDRLGDDTIAILDYKSGAKKRLLTASGDVQEAQLFVYSMAASETVAALALVNIDSREIGFEGAGRGYTDESAWPQMLESIQQQLLQACAELQAGDVRLNLLQGNAAARPLNLLSRYSELRRGDI